MSTLFQQMLSADGGGALLQERGEALLERIQALAPQHRTRPSLLTPFVRGAAFGLGAASACLPNHWRATVGGQYGAALMHSLKNLLSCPDECAYLCLLQH